MGLGVLDVLWRYIYNIRCHLFIFLYFGCIVNLSDNWFCCVTQDCVGLLAILNRPESKLQRHNVREEMKLQSGDSEAGEKKK